MDRNMEIQRNFLLTEICKTLEEILKEQKKQTEFVKRWMKQDEGYHERTLTELKKDEL